MSLSFSDILYVSFSFFVLAWIFCLDFTGQCFLDYHNYLNNFTYSRLNDFYQSLSSENTYFVNLLRTISEEYLWILYTSTISIIMTPNDCVVFTTLLLNLLLIISFKKLRHPFLALFFWIVLPMGLATIGLMQIRQGMAFAIFIFFSLSFSRPKLGALLAMLVHTTFVVPFGFLVISSMIKNKTLLVITIVLASIVVELLSIKYFSIFAGRRALQYKVDDFSNNINYLVGVVIMFIPTLITILKNNKWPSILTAHFGLFIWIFSCFFLFKLGGSRVGYYLWLFIIPLTEIWRKDKISLLYYTFFSFYLSWLIVQSWQQGIYKTVFSF